MVNWKKDLEAGQAAEQWLLEQYPDKLIKSANLKWDIETITGKKLEIKLERRSTDKLKNLFVETIANSNKHTFGGPFRALHDEVDYFGWLVSDSKKLYLFETQILVDEVLNILANNNFQIKSITNGSYSTLGYAIPISLLEPFCCDIVQTWS